MVDVFISIFIFILGIENASSCVDVLQMHLVPSMKNTIVTDLALWTRPGIGSAVACASDCVRHDTCVSIFYNVDSDKCTAHGVRYSSADPSIPDVGSHYYTMNIVKRDCSDILAMKPSSPNGVYLINPMDDLGAIRVSCDMTTDGGGWVVFQRRQDNSVDFYLNWADYKSGFGNLEGEFWLGNDIISRLTTGRPSMLRIDMRDQSDALGYAEYSSFRVDDEADNYRLTVSGFTGNRGDSLSSFHSGMLFSTKDRDQDTYYQNCAQMRYGGWWYRDCHQANLNGLFGNTQYSNGINWNSWHGFYYSLKWTEMKLKAV